MYTVLICFKAWIDTCVGLRNHRYFINLLLWLSTGCFYIALGSIILIREHAKRFIFSKWKLGCFSVAAGMCPVIFGFLVWHIYLVKYCNFDTYCSDLFQIFINQTTVERFITKHQDPQPGNSKSDSAVRESFNSRMKHAVQNFEIIFGTREYVNFNLHIVNSKMNSRNAFSWFIPCISIFFEKFEFIKIEKC